MDIARQIELHPTLRLRSKQMPPLEAVTAPTLLNSWVNAGGAYETAGYYKDPFGIVRLQGAIKTGAIGTVAFTLPANYRPRATMVFAVASTTTVPATIFGSVQVATSGDVTILTGDNNRVHLSGVHFRAAA